MLLFEVVTLHIVAYCTCRRSPFSTNLSEKNDKLWQWEKLLFSITFIYAIQEPEAGLFELVVENVEHLRQLISRIQQEQAEFTNAHKKHKVSEPFCKVQNVKCQLTPPG